MLSPVGLYVPRNSPLHRTTAGVKLAGLAVAAVIVTRLPTPELVGAATLVTALGFVVARIPARVVLGQLAPIAWIAVPLLAFHWATAGLEHAVVTVGRLLVLVMLAALVTLTTRLLVMMETFEHMLRPLTRLGVRPERIALLLALTVRCVPVVVEVYQQCREAQRARGLEWSPLALAVPLVVRLLKKADAIGEALAARGLDDW